MSDVPNPYEAPRSDEDAPPSEVHGDGLIDASRGTRFANLFIDYLFSFVLLFIVGLVVQSEEWGGFIGYPIMIGYYVFFETTFGATPGKMITKTRVVRVDGGKPSFGQILGRTLSRFVPFEPFSFFSSTSSGWHDRWSGTRVVRAGETR